MGVETIQAAIVRFDVCFFCTTKTLLDFNEPEAIEAAICEGWKRNNSKFICNRCQQTMKEFQEEYVSTKSKDELPKEGSK